MNAESLLEASGAQLANALQQSNDGLGTLLRLQSIMKNPPRPDAKFPTFTARIGFALPDQQRQRDRLLAGEPSANVIPVEMTLNEIVCEWNMLTISDSEIELNVSSINDIVAEKLRAILQQEARNKYRSQDILDIASICGADRLQLDASKVSEFLLRKSAARDIEVSRAAFHVPAIRERSASQYQDLQATTRYHFIPFDEAWSTAMGFVDTLDIPA